MYRLTVFFNFSRAAVINRTVPTIAQARAIVAAYEHDRRYVKASCERWDSQSKTWVEVSL